MPESYLHYYAKKVLAEWLRASARSITFNEEPRVLIDYSSFRAIVEPDDPFKGVYEEYPICLVHSKEDTSLTNLTTLTTPWPPHQIPTYSQLLQENNPPAFILDLAIKHLGNIKYGIEIVHRSDVSLSKVIALKVATQHIPFELYRIKAEWILEQCCTPYRLKMERLIAYNPKSN